MKYRVLLILGAWGGLFLGNGAVWGQGAAHISGSIVEEGGGQALAGVVVRVVGTDTVYGAISDVEGRFKVDKIPYGRYDIDFSFVGFVKHRVSEVLLTNPKGVELLVSLEETGVETQTVEIFSNQKWETKNEAALVSGRSFSREELSRIAGNIDDPARAAARFPGVVPSSNITYNSIQVRGNPSRAVLWRLEGIDIYNPNHFGLLEGSGGNITLFSQQLLAQTDFFSGAFPADYGNALGSVFDVRFRNGARDRAHLAFQVGMLGIDAAIEGPIGKQKKTAYLMNYRYSTTGIIDRFIGFGSVPVFQDFSFKLNHNFKSGAQVNFFGIGGISSLTDVPNRDTSAWDSLIAANVGSDARSLTGTVGLNYSLPLDAKTYFKIVGVGTGLTSHNYRYNLDRQLKPDTTRKGESSSARLSAQAFVNRKFGPRHTHRTGIMAHRLNADVFYASPLDTTKALDTLYRGRGNSYLLQFYTRSQFKLGTRMRLHAGIHAMYLGANQQLSLEPRVGVRYLLNERLSLAFGYGLHSQMEPYFTYVIESRAEDGSLEKINRKLPFNQSHHFVLNCEWRISERVRFLVEAYFQPTTRLVVGRQFPVSRLGGLDFKFESLALDATGSARTYGLDLSLERSLHNGYYFMVNTSLLDATYNDGRGNEFPSQFDVGYMGNLVGGKEWYLKPKKNKTRILGLNLAMSYIGAQRYTGIDLAESVRRGGYYLDYTSPNAYKQSPLQILDLGLTYRVSRKRISTFFSLQIKNMLNQRALLSQTFDVEKGIAGENRGVGILPLVSYRIQL